MSPTCSWLSQAEISTSSKSQRLLPRSLYLFHQFFSIPWEKTTMASFHDASLTSVVIRSRSARIFFYHHGRRCGRIIRKRQFLPCAPGHSQFFHVFHRTPCLCSRGRLQPLARTSYPCSRTVLRVKAQVVQDLDSRDLGMGSVKVLDQVGDPA